MNDLVFLMIVRGVPSQRMGDVPSPVLYIREKEREGYLMYFKKSFKFLLF